MVTVRNDIESATNGIVKAKEVNLPQFTPRPKKVKKRSYRCVTLVGLTVVLLLALGVGSVLIYERFVDHIPVKNGDGHLTVEGSSTVGYSHSGPDLDARWDQSGPTPIDTFDSGEPKLESIHPTDNDREIFIDSDESTDREKVTDYNASVHEGADASSEEDYGSGSGSGDGADLRFYTFYDSMKRRSR